MKINGFQQLVGKTKLVRLNYFSELTGCEIFGKCEFENPGGSIKDRTALSLILGAEQRGTLKRGEPGVIIEGTAGNTGIGLALAAQSFGYHCIICIAETQSVEKKNFLRWAGAHLVEVPAVPFSHPNNYVHVASRLSENLSKNSSYRAFYANQWDNPDNKAAHFATTGPEIWNQVMEITGRPVDAFSCAVGTGGTLSGVAEFLRSKNPEIKIGLTDPRGASLVNYFNSGEMRNEGSSISEGIGQNRITGNLEGFKPDVAMELTDENMMDCLNLLQKHEGLSLGTSAGINVAGAVEMAKLMGPGHIISTVLCDLGQRYASKIYNEKFLLSKNLPVASWIRSRATDRWKDNKELYDALKEAVGETLE